MPLAACVGSGKLIEVKFILCLKGKLTHHSSVAKPTAMRTPLVWFCFVLLTTMFVTANVVVEEIEPDLHHHFIDYGGHGTEVLNELGNHLHSKSQIIDVGYGLEHEEEGLIDVSFGLEPNHPVHERPLVRPYVPPIIVDSDEVVALPTFPGYVHEEEETQAEEIAIALPPPLHGHTCKGHGVCHFVNHDICLCHCEPGYINEASVCILESCNGQDYRCQEKLAMRRALNAELVTAECEAEAFRAVDGICHSNAGQLDVIVGQHLVPGHHSVLHATRAHNFAACERECVQEVRCEFATYEHSQHQCLMYDVEPAVLVVTDFQPAVEAVLLIKRHYEVRPGTILAHAPRLGTVVIERARGEEVVVVVEEVGANKIIVDYSAHNDDVFKACEAECDSVPECHGITVQFSTGLCKLFGMHPKFKPASAVYSNMWSGIKKEHKEEVIIEYPPIHTTSVVTEPFPY